MSPKRDQDGRVREFQAQDAAASVFAPREDDHKYRRGVAAFVTGSTHYPGAAVLGTRAALATGIGMVRYSGGDAETKAVLWQSPEVVADLASFDALVVGSGVDPKDVRRTSEAREALDRARELDATVIADSGALGQIAKRVLGGHHVRRCILTPHAAELAALITKLENTEVHATDVIKEPEQAVRLVTDRLGCTLVLKGHRTYIAGDGPTIIVDAPGAWLATAGTGDVLAGAMGALSAVASKREVAEQPEPQQLAAAAVWLHARAGWLASQLNAGNTAASAQLLAPIDELRAHGPGAPIRASDATAVLPRLVGALVASKLQA